MKTSANRLAAPLRGVVAAWLLLAALWFAAASAWASAPGAPTLERSVKAAFLFKFLAYADFPAKVFQDGNSPLVLGVVGSEDMSAELERIVAGRSVNGRAVMVRSVHEGEAMPPVHLLFVAGSDCARLARVLRQSPAAPILLVSECGNGLQTGSVINFTLIGHHVRFDVSLDAADRNNIKLSSRLLSVANHVSKGTP